MILTESHELVEKARELNEKADYAGAERYANIVLTETSSADVSYCSAVVILAESLRRQGKYGQAIDHAETALALAQEYGYHSIERTTWSILGNVYRDLGSYDKALGYFGKALTAYEEAGEKFNSAVAMGNIGNIYLKLGSYDMTLEFYGKALAIHEEAGDQLGIARITGNMGVIYRRIGSFDKALEYQGKALAIYKMLDRKLEIANITANMGYVYGEIGSFDIALEYIFTALAGYNEISHKSGIASATGALGSVYLELGSHDKALEYYNKALSAHEELGEKSAIARVMGNIGSMYNSLGMYDKALEYFSKSLNAHQELGEESGVAIDTDNIGCVYLQLGHYNSALEYFGISLATHQKLGQKAGIAAVTGNIGSMYAMREFSGYDTRKAEEYLQYALALNQEYNAKKKLYENHLALVQLLAQENRWQEAYGHYAEYHKFEKEVQSDEATKKAQMLEHRRKIEEAERDRQFKIAQHKVTVELLHKTLPPSIATRLINGEKNIADKFDAVSVLFADIVGFTPLAAHKEPKEMVKLLNTLFTRFDRLTEYWGVERIKTIGDAYMAAAGAPEPCNDHAGRIAGFAVAILEESQRFSNETGENIQLRIGMSSGEVVGAVVGETKFSYDLWSDTVNTASRMESHGEGGKIHCSEAFAKALAQISPSQTLLRKDGYYSFSFSDREEWEGVLSERGDIEIKGKGRMRTYFLEKRQY